MNIGASELTEIALQIMGYKMFDRDGAPADSLEKVIEKYQFASTNPMSAVRNAHKRKQSPMAAMQLHQHEQQFLAQFNLPDFNEILLNPNGYVDGQIASFLNQIQEQLAAMRVQDENMRRLRPIRLQNVFEYDSDSPSFITQMKRTIAAMSAADEDELLSRSTQDIDVEEHILLKQGLLLREFNMLLQLLKHIMEDLSDDLKDYDMACLMLQRMLELIKKPRL
uniref:Uncharacterized protein n=1 Tax=Anopheles dirus TaxID=7168 RepID=A0A182NTE6_9DIPT